MSFNYGGPSSRWHWKYSSFKEYMQLGEYDIQTPPVINHQGGHPGWPRVQNRTTQEILLQYCRVPDGDFGGIGDQG